MKKIDFDYLCDLANLELSGSEKNRLLPQLQKIVGWVNQLEELNIKNEEEKSTGGVGVLILRKDEGEAALSLQDVLSSSPESNKSFIKVPKVIETK